jgi:hypothetical protein
VAKTTNEKTTGKAGAPQKRVWWLGWAYLAKKVPHAATTPIATAFKICISHKKMGF